METTIKDRLIAYLSAKKIKKAEFGRLIGVSGSYVTSLKKTIATDKLAKIREAFPDLNIDWLVSGVGEMLRGSSAAPATAIAAGDSSIAVNTNNGNIGGIPALIEHIEFLRRSIADRDKIIETYKRLVEAQERQLQMLQSQVTEHGTKNDPK